MKKRIAIIPVLTLTLLLILSGCKKDNNDPGSVPASFYWSSSEVVALTPPNAGVFWVSFFDGGNGQVNKNDNTLSVRAVRSF